jgi:ribosomal protein S12 methylthiotransferase
MKVTLVSLGCLKNQADSEDVLRFLAGRGFEITDRPEEADVLMVNTCGFIEDAKLESIDMILELEEIKDEGQRLVVLGCLSKRYGDALVQEFPEVDAFFGLGEKEAMAEYIKPGASEVRAPDRLYIAAPTFAPLKAAEGCSRSCTFCVIPAIRGPYESRPGEELMEEAGRFLKSGIRELLVVAQDLTSYGRDLGGKYGLPELLGDLAGLDEGEYRVRPLYLYPGAIDDRLLDAMAGHERICKYFDIPLQHSEETVLKAMGRAGGAEEHMRLIQNIKERVPGAVLRTTLIVGFPGESERDFDRLLEFVEDARFDHLGVFEYSDEEGTRAHRLGGKVPEEVREQRLEELMGIQAEISREINESMIGSVMRALVDEAAEDGGAVGRFERQAPEVDGVTYLRGCDAPAGSFVDVEVTGASDYDLEGECA